MDLNQIERIKRIVITSIFSDDELMNFFVLKGANVLDLIYQISPRASMDIDFSLEGDFPGEELVEISKKLERALERAFYEEALYLFDFRFDQRPKEMKQNIPAFWGGYLVKFKVIPLVRHTEIGDDLERLRREAAIVGLDQKKTFSIDISKYEYTGGKEQHFEGGVVVFTYSPSMILIEKLRAICQQMDEYGDYVPNPTRSARARDFFDIHTLCENFSFDFQSVQFGETLVSIFEAKKVPLNLIKLIPNYREFHRPDFQRVIDTVKQNVLLQDFDFYFDYVLELCERLETFWIK